MEFGAGGDYQIVHGLPWAEVAEIIGLPISSGKYRNIQITDNVFEKLCKRLEALNTDPEIGGAPIFAPDHINSIFSDCPSYEELLEDFYDTSAAREAAAEDFDPN